MKILVLNKDQHLEASLTVAKVYMYEYPVLTGNSTAVKDNKPLPHGSTIDF